MLTELFQLWADKVTAAKQVSVEEFDRFKDRLVTLPSGETTVEYADAPNRAHTAASINTLRYFVVKFIGDDETNAAHVAVWYERGGVTVILDENTNRRNKITMKLEFSPQLLKLAQLEKGRPSMLQSDAIKMLRLEFRDCGLGNLPDMLRKVNFTVNEEGQSEVQRTRVSVGKSVLSQYHGLDALPEEIAFVVPIFVSKFEALEPIMVAIEPDPTTKKFSFIPFGRQIEQAIQRAESRLGDELRATMPEGVPCLFGSP